MCYKWLSGWWALKISCVQTGYNLHHGKFLFILIDRARVTNIQTINVGIHTATSVLWFSSEVHRISWRRAEYTVRNDKTKPALFRATTPSKEILLVVVPAVYYSYLYLKCTLRLGYNADYFFSPFGDCFTSWTRKFEGKETLRKSWNPENSLKNTCMQNIIQSIIHVCLICSTESIKQNWCLILMDTGIN